MSEPRKDDIAEAAVTALEAVSRGAGYFTDLGRHVSRRRWLITDLNQSMLPCASVWIGEEEPSPVPCMGSYKSRVVLLVEGWIRAERAEDVDRLTLRMEADIKRAVLTNTTLGLTGVRVEPLKVQSDHQEYADNKVGWKAVGFTVDFTWTAIAP